MKGTRKVSLESFGRGSFQEVTHGVAQRNKSLLGSWSEGLISYIGGSGGKKASFDATESTMRFILLVLDRISGVVPPQTTPLKPLRRSSGL